VVFIAGHLVSQRENSETAHLNEMRLPPPEGGAEDKFL